MLKNLQSDFKKLANPEKAKILAGFFKTGKGEYGEGDIFLGIIVPEQRKIAKKYQNLDLKDLQKLLNSKIHEERLTALFILVDQYQRAKKDSSFAKATEDREQLQKKLIDFYLKNTKNINNWDLVDLSAPKILGNFLLNHDRKILYQLAQSENLWEKRIAILATYTFIKTNDFEDCLNIVKLLLKDKHDLIHKASGWMLREIGKKDLKVEENFLKKYYKDMPRTMLRYAIEKFEVEKRKNFLKI
ncbi:DNA alkylation repair protein [Candidatus Peregrinibacteria bacterium RIFOXYB2_FULL_32_7]|nr:MAG: DNA alkylation repair protein [Candidatus Peregrinibacteria bacterium RIFOXYB2_FULL_32_7]